MTKVLVSGANGRTGRAIVQALARAGSPRVPVVVRALLRNAAQWPTVAALGASEHAIGDMAEMEAVYESERHLLYVACTRPRDRLMVSAIEPGSEFIEDLFSRSPK